ncbi:MAG: glycoside hydrolase [Clostridia bacterium]|nr:glycoside hydrolase [Clostridia bacterium]
MQARQITTYAVHSRAITEETVLPVTLEADEPRHLESGVINLYPDIRYQEIEGFGGALTDTVGYLYSKMTPECKRQFLEAYFGENGQHYRFLRMHIDSCDYSLDEYQAVADPVADPDFATFTLARDRKYMLPMLKDAMAMTAQPFSVLLSPWSPPRQWKTPPARPRNDASVYGGLPGFRQEIDYDYPSRCNGGSLKKEHYGDWARYLVKYVLAYLDEGVPVTMLSLQNESIAATEWDSCVWTAAQQKEFLRDHLYPAFEAAGLAGRVGLYIWDHNKERAVEYPREIIDETTCKMLEGIAFHWYSGDHFEALRIAHELFPDMKLMSSECCALHPPGQTSIFAALFGGGPSVAEVDYRDAAAYAHDMIGNLNNGMNRWIDWNLCVDQNGGPRHVASGFGAPVCANEDGTWRKLLTFDYIGHFSRHILPGARRIAFSRCDDRVDVTAARNPDGSVAVVLLNRGEADLSYALRLEGKVIRVSVPAHTLSTLCLPEA